MIKDGTCVCKYGPAVSGTCPSAITPADIGTNITTGDKCGQLFQHLVYDHTKKIFTCRYNFIPHLTSCLDGKLTVSDYFTEAVVVNCAYCKDNSLRLVDYDFTRSATDGICVTKAECDGTTETIPTPIDYTSPNDYFINAEYDTGVCRCSAFTQEVSAYGCIEITPAPTACASDEIRFHGTCIAIADCPADASILHSLSLIHI